MASTISAGLTTTTSLSFSGDTSGVLQLQTNGTTTAVTIDTAQNVGVGVTPSAWATVLGSQVKSASIGGTSSQAFFSNGAYYNAGWKYISTGISAQQYAQDGGQHYWSIAPSGTAGNAITFTQAMTLDNSGNLLVGQTSVSQTTVGFSVLGSGPSQGQVTSVQSGSTNATTTWNTYSTGAGAYRFYVDMGGTIHATSTSITAISDASLKTNIKPLETGLAEINRLQPRRFDWLDQDKNEGTNIAGFISQEVQEVLPDLTPNFKYNETETKLGLKMGDMIPTMVKAIQELSAKVTALEAKVG